MGERIMSELKEIIKKVIYNDINNLDNDSWIDCLEKRIQEYYDDVGQENCDNCEQFGAASASFKKPSIIERLLKLLTRTGGLRR